MTFQSKPRSGNPPPGALQPDAELMPIDTDTPVCPRELQYLTVIDQLLVRQKEEISLNGLNCENKNKYIVKNILGQNIYTAREDTGCCTRNCCGSCRPFDLKIKNNYGTEIIHLSRDLRCSFCCFPCCLQRLEVFAPPGQFIGAVVQKWSIFKPQFQIENESGDAVLKIEGPFCTFSFCGSVNFQVLSTDGIEVGKISKKWSGLLRETFTDVDHFGISFPLELDVKMKATLLGALFLIDYMYFETTWDEDCDFC
ncbi:phospholipid scramblase 2-like [Argiope bruennichi]|uniref:Phospholipid scramblase n=1 Tax=Argiope bruennichi TaxID=94029 RepID=A0A8T0FLX2_ARGBR|nr:phospholipid scramblase 2-like [Argiope bruennichi]XP_055939959.1 phospholipid scramblase 2-like [Argiope bruennichi]KAF8791906.1 Phospholipid scramblase 2 like protein [Argiope bruennichi]